MRTAALRQSKQLVSDFAADLDNFKALRRSFDPRAAGEQVFPSGHGAVHKILDCCTAT
jgi:hypothetical protein